MRKFFLPFIASVTICGSAAATPVILDFDNLSTGEVASNQLRPFVTVSATGGAGQAIAFDTQNPTGGDEDLVLLTNVNPTPGNPSPGGNVLIIAENLTDTNNDGFVDIPDDNAGGGTFTFDFSQPVNFVGFNAIDFTDSGSFVQIDLFNGSTNIFSFLVDDAAPADLIASVGDNAFLGLFANVFGEDGISGVTQAEITLGGSGAIDSLSLHVGEVPVPAALPLMLSALGFGGFASRRRKAKLARS